MNLLNTEHVPFSKAFSSLINGIGFDPNVAADSGEKAVFGSTGWIAILKRFPDLFTGNAPSSQADLAAECGYNLLSVPWLARYLAVRVVGDTDHSMIAGLNDGTLTACAHLPIHLPADLKVEDGTITGSIGPITHALDADLLVTVVPGGQVALVDLQSGRTSREPADSLTQPSRSAVIRLERAPVLLLSDTPGISDSLRYQASILSAFEQIGGARRCLDQTVDYAKTRHAFGQPIAAFQSVKHKLADMLVKTELARANAESAILAIQDGSSELVLAACFARISASEACVFAAQEGMHLHGAFGTTWDSGMHLHLRRARALARDLGSPSSWRQILAKELRALPEDHVMGATRNGVHSSFRSEARAWLTENAKPNPANFIPQGIFRGYTDKEEVSAARQWQRRKFDAGWAGISWPTEVGGKGESVLKQVIWDQEENSFEIPRNLSFLALSHVGYAIIQHGSPEQQAEILPRILRGEDLWCQLFSEPNAGSDLAALEMSATERNGNWILSGVKVWTSDAAYADRGLLIARTDPDVPKHRGLTAFLVDMKDPGIEVEDIRSASGGSHFSKVTFTNVLVADTDRLGDVNGGWSVCLTTLMAERLLVSLPIPFSGFGGPKLADLVHIVQEVDQRFGDDDRITAIWQVVADFMIKQNALESLSHRLLTDLEDGAPLGSEAAIVKLAANDMGQSIVNAGLDLLGDFFPLDEIGMKASFEEALFERPMLKIAGGTDEILRTIIGERMLGLPQDAFAPKSISFNAFKALAK